MLVAGRATELGEASGLVDGEVFDGIDVVAFLDDLLDRLGAPRPATSTAPVPTTTGGRR